MQQGLTSGDYWSVFIIVWFTLTIVCGAISQGKGRGLLPGLVLGAFLGVIGLIIVLVEKPGMTTSSTGLEVPQRECPFCRQSIRADASVCRYCQRESPAWTHHQGYWWTRNEADDWYRLNPSTREWERVEGD